MPWLGGSSHSWCLLSVTADVSGLVSGVTTGVRFGVVIGLMLGVDAAEGPLGVRSLWMSVAEMLRSTVLSSTLPFSKP